MYKRVTFNTIPGLGIGVEYYQGFANFIPGLLKVRVACFEINITI